MKKIRFIIVFALFAFSFIAFSQQSRKVLFLGNSYTYVNDLPQIISQLAISTGDVLIYDSNALGGSTLLNHSTSSISQNKILSDDWDYIVLQEQSQTPTFIVPFAFMDGFSNLNTFISQNKPCAQITSFMTWGHENGDTQNCATNPTVCTYSGMQNLLTERYMEFSNLFESEVTPVGVVWKYIRENYPTINLYQSDGSHPSLAGSYLAACCFYTSIFRKDPTLISNNYGLDVTTATIIRNATKSIVFDQMLTWYIGKYVPNADFNHIIGNGTNEVILSSSNTTDFQDSVLWDFGDGTTSTENNPTHSYAADGSYTIKLTAYKCFLYQNLESIMEKTVNFCSHTNTVFPNNLILCPNETATIETQLADSYQWLDYFGSPIAGATNQSLVVSSGEYSVQTTINGCTERSPQVLVDGWLNNPDCDLSIIDIKDPFKISISPNPAHDIINIDTSETIKEILAFDISGKKVAIVRVSETLIDVSSLQEGLYIIKVINESEEIFYRRFLKSN
ncbi:MAG: T9SS type A sorting domain-containing protein [Flavobacteriales bacterium]|nr:T9SS type A sorting domain-containing protein [Flavobacteriales bacterium]